VLLVWSNFRWSVQQGLHISNEGCILVTGRWLLFVLAKDTLAVCEEKCRPGGEERLVAAVWLRVHPCGLGVCSVTSCLVVRDSWPSEVSIDAWR
jgi:hypothetical protein